MNFFTLDITVKIAEMVSTRLPEEECSFFVEGVMLGRCFLTNRMELFTFEILH